MKLWRRTKPTQAYELPLTDNLTAAQRSDTMRRVKSKDTFPELHVRCLLRQLGYSGYRLHRSDLPGRPDIAWIGRRHAIFINGCFWHGHACPHGVKKPQTRPEYWLAKIEHTRQRDASHVAALAAKGWSVLVVWECELCNEESMI
jgi:DNA mismatch endonuclease (patch repair protein)